MHYFSIQNLPGEHLGFLVMLPDDEPDQSESGRFIVKLQSEALPKDGAAADVLASFTDLSCRFSWRTEKDKVLLFREEEEVGSICGEFLRLGSQTLVLGDMTGMI